MPDALTLEEADELPNFRTFTEKGARENAIEAYKFARKVGGVVWSSSSPLEASLDKNVKY